MNIYDIAIQVDVSNHNNNKSMEILKRTFIDDISCEVQKKTTKLSSDWKEIMDQIKYNHIIAVIRHTQKKESFVIVTNVLRPFFIEIFLIFLQFANGISSLKPNRIDWLIQILIG